MRSESEATPEEITLLLENLEQFSEREGFNTDQEAIAKILVLSQTIGDIEEIARYVGRNVEFTQGIVNKIGAQGIQNHYDEWLGENGDTIFLLDVLTLGGMIEQRVEGGRVLYRMAPLKLGDHVRHRSGMGSGWTVIAEKMQDDKQFIKLTRLNSSGPGGKWRLATDYTIR